MRDDLVEAELAALRARVHALEEKTGETREVIRAQRVDIVEPDGRVRLALANGPLSPDAIVDGVVLAAGRERPGIIFFNDVGDECGGLTFGGKVGADGEPAAGAVLTMDRFRQDQVVAIVYAEEGGEYEGGMRIVDRPTVSLVEAIEVGRDAQTLPEGPERESARSRVREGRLFGAQRLFVGRSVTQEAVVELRDDLGRTRLRLSVAADGNAGIEFLTADGEVARRIEA